MRTDKLYKICWVDWYIAGRMDTFPDLDKRFGRSQFVDDFLAYAVRDNIMPKPKGKSNARNTSTSNFEWLNVTLSDEDVDAIGDAELIESEIMLGILGIATSGRSVSLKFNSDKDQYSATAFGQSDDSSGGNIGLSAFSDDPLHALYILCYKYHTVLGGKLVSSGVPGTAKRRYG